MSHEITWEISRLEYKRLEYRRVLLYFCAKQLCFDVTINISLLNIVYTLYILGVINGSFVAYCI